MPPPGSNRAKSGFSIFSWKGGGRNSEILTSRLRFSLVNVMERDEGVEGVEKVNFSVTYY